MPPPPREMRSGLRVTIMYLSTPNIIDKICRYFTTATNKKKHYLIKCCAMKTMKNIRSFERFYPILMFGVVGTCNTALAFGLFALFWKILALNYLLAITLTYALSATFQFFANRKVTFRSSSGNLGYQLLKYGVVLIINYMVTVSAMYLTVSTLGFSPYIGMFSSTLCSAIVSFILFNFWVFRKTPT